jgi:hypothetical protein
MLASFWGSLSWRLAVLLIYAPILTLPYSKDSERLWYVVALTVAGLISGIVLGHCPLGFLQAILAFVVGIFFLINHPEPAVNEEGLIALISVVVIPFML